MNRRAGFAFLLSLVSFAANAAPADDAAAFLALLSGQKYQAAVEDFDQRMKDGLPAAKLESVWQGLVGQLGAFQNTGETKTASAQGYTLVYVKTNFARGAIWAQVAYDKDGKVAGLHFLPTSPSAP